jgi:glycerophosphoryl diester phosphodiesterase
VDNHLIVMHDAKVDRTTNASGEIREMTFDTIRQLDAGNGEQVPTLDEVLAVTKGKATLLSWRENKRIC